jgi:hypothetical protein
MINRLPKEFQVPRVNGARNVRAAAATVSKMPRHFLGQAARCVGEHPIAALGAALVAGMIIGRWVKR